MSYQVLARKWRPRSFETLVGQNHVVRALTHALEQKRLHHAYLFTGTRGVGKTTLARILAKALNCEAGISAKPCEQCASCREIDMGRFVDLIEVDAATNTKVDEMRQLLENATYAPTRGRYKVYVIDEVHMLSTSAFNAMLKTLEEPPEHIKFILATTDPQKIPVTVLSRCLQFNLKQMPESLIAEHLARILEAENVPFETPALRRIAKAGAGSMRDALSLVDQAIAHGAGRVEDTGVRDMLGTVGDEHLHQILEALSRGDVARMIAVADDMETRSLSFESALQELGTLLHRVALAQFAPAAITDPEEREGLDGHAQRFDPEFVQLAYQIVVQGRGDLPLAPDAYSGFTMMLIRLAAFSPVAEASGSANAGPGAPVGPPKGQAIPQGASPSRSPQSPAPASSESALGSPSAVAVCDWHALIPALGVGGLVRELAQHCEWIEEREGEVRLRLSQAHRALLMNSGARDRLEAALRSHLRRPLRLSIELGQTASETPAERQSRARQERFDNAVAALEQDSFVRDVIDMFDASLNESSIKPV